jgi:hypothetical protein
MDSTNSMSAISFESFQNTNTSFDSALLSALEPNRITPRNTSSISCPAPIGLNGNPLEPMPLPTDPKHTPSNEMNETGFLLRNVSEMMSNGSYEFSSSSIGNPIPSGQPSSLAATKHGWPTPTYASHTMNADSSLSMNQSRELSMNGRAGADWGLLGNSYLLQHQQQLQQQQLQQHQQHQRQIILQQQPASGLPNGLFGTQDDSVVCSPPDATFQAFQGNRLSVVGRTTAGAGGPAQAAFTTGRGGNAHPMAQQQQREQNPQLGSTVAKISNQQLGKWQQRFDDLLEFRKEYEHCCVPTHWPQNVSNFKVC